MKRAALYLRVSKDDGTMHTENQVPDLERMTAVRGFDVVERYIEHVSAVKVRPEFDRMKRDAHRAKFDTLFIWAIDRFGRSTLENLLDVHTLHRCGVDVVSYQEAWLDMRGPLASGIVAMLSWVAEKERERLRERTIAGMARARAEGKRIGRPRKDVSELAVRAAEEGGGTRKRIARELGVSGRTLRRKVPQRPKGGGLDVAENPSKSHRRR